MLFTKFLIKLNAYTIRLTNKNFEINIAIRIRTCKQIII